MENSEVHTLPIQVKRKQQPPREDGLEVFADTIQEEDLRGPECHFRQGIRAFKHGRPEEAITHFEAAKLTTPRCTPWIDVAIAVVESRDDAHSEQVVQLLRKNPIIVQGKDAVALGLLARAYLRNKQPLMASGLLQGLIEREPNDHAAHYTLGMAYFEMGKSELGLECIYWAISLSEGVARYYRQACQILRHLGRLTEALDVALAAVSCDSYDPASHELLAEVFSDLGDHEGKTFHQSYAFVLREVFSEL